MKKILIDALDIILMLLADKLLLVRESVLENKKNENQ